MQKVLIALVPILFPDSSAVQIILLSAFIMLYLVIVTNLTPWVTAIANFADTFLNSGLLFFLLIAAFLVDGNDTHTRTIIGYILLLVVICIVTTLNILVLHAIYSKLFPRKMYDMFLCHHKAGAGVLCRWLKTEILRQTSGHARIFLDSDELEGLADIGDLVKSQSATFPHSDFRNYRRARCPIRSVLRFPTHFPSPTPHPRFTAGGRLRVPWFGWGC